MVKGSSLLLALCSAAIVGLLLVAFACQSAQSTATKPPLPTPAPTSTVPPTRVPTLTPASTPTLPSGARPALGATVVPPATPEPKPVSPNVYPEMARSAVTILMGTVEGTQPESLRTQPGSGGYGLVFREWQMMVDGYVLKPQPFNVVKVRTYIAATNSADPRALAPLAIPEFSPGEKVMLALDKWELQGDPLGANEFTIVGAHAYEATEYTGYFQLNGNQARITKAFVPPPAYGPWQPLDQIVAALNAPLPTNTPCPP